MKRYVEYLKAVLRHKKFVLMEGIALRVPLWILILHDWDKFLPFEFKAYAESFYNEDGSKKQYQIPESGDFTVAWMRHLQRHKHHWQWWLEWGNTPMRSANILVWDRGDISHVMIRSSVSGENYEIRPIENHSSVPIKANPMDDVFIREMVADWKGAGRAYGNSDTISWYLARQGLFERYMHPHTRKRVEELLGIDNKIV